jgi:YYY domain-containing protein
MQVLTFEWLRWLATLELIGLAALPLTLYCFRAFPDAGYGLSKVLGIVAIGFVNWWLGSTIGIANVPGLLWLILLVLACSGALLFRRQPGTFTVRGRSVAQLALQEEALFLLAFVAWSFVRAINPDVHDSERPMDYMLLQASGGDHRFPPPDRWLAGYSVNYYYLGYALFAMIGRMSLVAPRLGFNLSNITIFALGCACAYTVTAALVRDRRWGPAGIFTVMLAGNLQGLGQVLTQVKQGASHATGMSLWCSTRIIGGGCNSYTAITEFPIFSAIWGDLHPHFMALPFALLTIALAIHGALEPPAVHPDPLARYLPLSLIAVVLGALFPLNSWDYPTYMVLVMAAMLMGLARRDGLSTRPVLETLAVVPVSLIIYMPYYVTVHNTTALGFQPDATPLNQVLAVIGTLLIPASLLLLWQGWESLQAGMPRATRPDRGVTARWIVAGAVLLLILMAPARTDLVYAVLLLLGMCVIVRQLRHAGPETLMAVLLTLLAVLVLLIGDFIYIRDPSDHTPAYRLNTLFKLYYQAWLMLGVVTPFAIGRIWQALARRGWRFPFRLWSTGTIVLALGLAMYPVEGVASQTRTQAVAPGLDGLVIVRDTDPPEYAAICWVLRHTSPTDVIAEGFGSRYWGHGTVLSPNELTTLTGRQSILAWPDGHETLWRNGFGATGQAAAVRQMLEQRATDITDLYLSTSIPVAKRIIRRYHIAYVFIGPYEWQAFSADPTVERAGFAKFHRFLLSVLEVRGPTRQTGVTLYAVPLTLRR